MSHANHPGGPCAQCNAAVPLCVQRLCPACQQRALGEVYALLGEGWCRLGERQYLPLCDVTRRAGIPEAEALALVVHAYPGGGRIAYVGVVGYLAALCEDTTRRRGVAPVAPLNLAQSITLDLLVARLVCLREAGATASVGRAYALGGTSAAMAVFHELCPRAV